MSPADKAFASNVGFHGSKGRFEGRLDLFQGPLETAPFYLRRFTYTIKCSSTKHNCVIQGMVSFSPSSLML